MPFFILNNNNQQTQTEFKGSLDNLFETHPHLCDEARSFHQKDQHKVEKKGLLYIRQRELAVTSKNDSVINIMGSDEATTCHIVILIHKSSGIVGLAHLDGVGTATAMATMITEMKRLSLNEECLYSFHLHMFGGFSDNRDISKELSNEILDFAKSCPETIILESACITPMNTIEKNGILFPVIYGVAIDVNTLDIFPAEFLHKGPDASLRSCRNGTGLDVLSIYDNENHQIIIPPFQYKPISRAHSWLTAPNEFILKYLSTSPEQEPADFVSNVKRTIRFTLENPPATIFKDNKARKHSVNSEGEWMFI